MTLIHHHFFCMHKEHIDELFEAAWRIAWIEENHEDLTPVQLKSLIYGLGVVAYRRLNFSPKALTTKEPGLMSPNDPADAIEFRQLNDARTKRRAKAQVSEKPKKKSKVK